MIVLIHYMEGKIIMGKTKAHTVYKNAERKRVPGVTTIVGELGWNKRVLIKWSNNLGLKGEDSDKFRDDKADIGVLGHAIITEGLQGRQADTSDYSENQIKAAENSVLSFYEWEKDHKVEPILIEQPIVSEILKVGGTPDIYGKVNGLFELIDLKTGSGIYAEAIVQTSTYAEMLRENGHPVDKVRILNIPRTEDEGFDEKLISNDLQQVAFKVFKHCRETYELHKIIRF